MQSFGLVLKVRGMAYTAKSQNSLVLMKKLQAKSAILLFAATTFFFHVFCTGVYTDVIFKQNRKTQNMNLIELLKSISEKEYESEDGNIFSLNLHEGLSNTEINEFKSRLPKQHLPKGIEDLLKFSKGFDCPPVEEVSFTAYGHFGFEEAFPYSIKLAGDGFGNFWILDIDEEGSWNEIFYVCHDPPVIVKQAKNLKEFITQLNDLVKNPNGSFVDKVHEEIVFQIWNEEKRNIFENYSLKDLEQKYHSKISEKDYIADLNQKQVGEGFVWALNGPNTVIERISYKPIWAIKNQVKNINSENQQGTNNINSFNFINWLKSFWKKASR
jgi:hypothetical protein